MNEYNFNVKFEKGKISSNLKKLVQNDYNSIKINFTFDKEGRKLFKMLYPDSSAYITQIDNNELIFGPGILNQDGIYEVEIALYTEDGRLTDYATTKFDVRAELIQSDEIVEVDDRLPILDSLINDIDQIKKDVEDGKFNGKDGEPGPIGPQGPQGETGSVDESKIPTKVSQLDNDSGYLTSIPSEYKTKTENDNLYQEKGNYLTSFTESDPTVPEHVKAITQSDITRWNTGGSSSSESSSSINYSLEEQVVGTWCDGKPLYKKTINYISATSVTNNSPINELVDHGIADVDMIFLGGESFMFSQTASPRWCHPANMINAGTNVDHQFMKVMVNPTQFKVYVADWIFGTGKVEGYLTVYYTKTTG